MTLRTKILKHLRQIGGCVRRTDHSILPFRRWLRRQRIKVQASIGQFQCQRPTLCDETGVFKLFDPFTSVFDTSTTPTLPWNELPRIWWTVLAGAPCYAGSKGSRAALAIHQKQTKDMLIVSRNMMRCESATCWNKLRPTARAWLDIAIRSATTTSVPATADSGVRNLYFNRIMDEVLHVSWATAIGSQ